MEASGLFDAAWYLARNPDVRRAGVDPLDHLIAYGAREGRDPGPGFDGASYLARDPAAAGSGLSAFEHYLRIGRAAGLAPRGQVAYAAWVARFDALTETDEDLIRADAILTPLPTVACLVVCPDGDETCLDRAGLPGQVGATPEGRAVTRCEPATTRILDGLPDGVVAILTGATVRLRPHAAYAFARVLDRDRVDAAYADHDHADPSGTRLRPVFKPAMAPDFMARHPYNGPAVAVRVGPGTRRAIATALDLALAGDPSRAFADLLLGLDPGRVARVPLILFTLPEGPDDGVGGGLHEVFEPAGQDPPGPVKPTLADPPRVTVLIPTRDRCDLLRACIDSIRARTDYPRDRYRIVVIDNDTREPASLAYLDDLAGSRDCAVVRSPGPFNFAKICNDGAAAADGSVLVFLNNDVTVRDPAWLAALVAQAIRPEIGLVGARLLYPDETVQHGGIVIGIRGVGAHRLEGLSEADAGRRDITREMTAVTGACVAVRRAVFEEVGGFDPVLAAAYNDVALCVRVFKAGYRNLYVARPLLYHHESQSRGRDDSAEKQARTKREAAYVRGRYGAFFQDDPAYSPNLSLERVGALAVPPRIVRPWRRVRSGGRALLLASPPGNTCGIARSVALQARAFQRRGWSVAAAGTIAVDGAFDPGCRVIQLATEAEAAALAVAEGFDCVVAQTAPFYAVGRRLGPRPLFYAFDHGGGQPTVGGAAFEEARFDFLLARRVFAASPIVRERHFRNDAVVMPLDGGGFAAWSSDRARCRTLARRALGFEGRFVVFTACEDPVGLDAYAALAAEALYAAPALADRVVFMAASRDADSSDERPRGGNPAVLPAPAGHTVAELCAASDLYVGLTRRDGYDLGLVQALAMGLDAVASDTSAHRDCGVPRTDALPELCRMVQAAHARWDQAMVARTSRFAGAEEPYTRMVDLIVGDHAAAGSSWL